MKEVAYIFPGQGAQYVGMGRSIYENFDIVHSLFDKACHMLGYDLTKVCFEGPKEMLSRTSISQPAILTVSIATLRVLELACPNINVKVTAGLSLGEYSGLVAAGSLSFDDAVYLVKKRGEFMDETSLKNPGKMLCILGLSLDLVQKICKQTNTEIANLNCPGQVVVSGRVDDIKNVYEMALKEDARAVYLDVSGPFHSSLMDEASMQLKKVLKDINIQPPRFPIVCNINAQYTSSSSDIINNLVTQVNHLTKWEESMRAIAQKGIDTFLEIGPGQVLRGLMRKINPDIKVINIETLEDIKGFSI